MIKKQALLTKNLLNKVLNLLGQGHSDLEFLQNISGIIDTYAVSVLCCFTG